jgi:Ca2+-transporting ATPase
VALFFVAQLQGFALQTSLVFALSIAVALVPQALPAQVSVALSQGSGRLAQRNAIVKKLNSMETLGSASTIATDKTGTLTKNEMTVRSLWFNDREYRVTGLGYKPEGDIVDEEGTPLSTKELDRLELMLDCATMASNAEIHPPDEQHHSWYPIGDPTEAALITLSTKAGVRSPREDQENPELEEFPFDSERKRMSSVREIDGRYVLCTKGAPESVLSVAKYWLKDGEVVELTPDKRRELRRIVTEWSARAMRVLAMAYRSLGEKKQDWVEEEVERHVVFLGLAAMVDPPREGVKQAVMEAHQAHIRTLMMTGDHAITARAIAEEVGLIKDNDRAVEYRMPGTVGVGAENKTAPQETELTKPAAAYELSSPLAPATAALRTQFDPETDTGPLASTVITGQELARYSAAELRHTLANYDSLIFSRVSPEDKLRVVKNLKEQGEVVAVTGDGVNDAPALKSAHIGVAMGRIGTDVAKEAAELVLLDDSYSTLVFAVKQGRIIYNNLKKTILASITTNIAELGVVLFSLVGVAVWGWPIAILAIQILTIDLLGEILPLTALTYDPGSGALMRGPPRDQDEHFFDTYTAAEVTFLGLLMAGLAFGGFYWFMLQNGVQLTEEHPLYARATTLTYTVIVFNQYINVLSRRFEFNSVSFQFWTNPILLGTILLSIGLVLLVIYVPFLAAFVGFAPLAPVDWAYVAFAMAVLLATHEAIKYRKRRS